MRLFEFAGPDMRTLYVCRPVVNGRDIAAWAQAQGFQSTLPVDDMHVTIAYSKEPVDWNALDRHDHEITLQGDERGVHSFDGGATVLQVQSPELSQRWQAFRNKGAAWSYPDYKSHVTISYALPDGMDVGAIKAYDGPIVLGPEKHNEIDEGWKARMSETDTAATI